MKSSSNFNTILPNEPTRQQVLNVFGEMGITFLSASLTKIISRNLTYSLSTCSYPNFPECSSNPNESLQK